MTPKKPRLSFRFVQDNGVITISACIPEEQVRHCGKVILGIIGSGTIWSRPICPYCLSNRQSHPPCYPLPQRKYRIH